MAVVLIGTTSAHAENTQHYSAATGFEWNYLRARGEYAVASAGASRTRELPPRTRRILDQRITSLSDQGTTSAHAENTFQVAADGCHSGNYLRARGEYMPPTPAVTGFLELPPRTRRIPRSVWPMVTTGGTTSAHAENTHVRVKYSDFPRNYLRARGEYFFQGWGAHNPPELPPRTRRIPFKKCFPDPKIRNYLRARGEYMLWKLRFY